MSRLRIFSYLPNPRVFKATIAGRLCGVEVDVRGAPPDELSDWLWDFEARPLTEHERQARASLRRDGRIGFQGKTLTKTDAFLAAQPFGTVPAAFSPDGHVGIFESNSIMRTVARLGHGDPPIYGRDPYEASRIDSFLDVGTVFGRDAQIYLLALARGDVAADMHARAAEAFATYLGGVEQALSPGRAFLVGECVTLADICFVAELCLFSNEQLRGKPLAERGLAPILTAAAENDYPRAMAHFRRLCALPAFAADVAPYLHKLTTAAARLVEPRSATQATGDDPVG